MLRGYQAQRGSVNAIATVDDVIDGMPDAHLARGKVKAEPEKEPFSAEDGVRVRRVSVCWRCVGDVFGTV